MIGFYLVGKKGFKVLQSIIEKFGTDKLSYVVVGNDKGIENDYFDEIQQLCYETNISCYPKGHEYLVSENAKYRISIGWRWMIKDTNGLVVFHDSLLPKYRGFCPLVNMLIEGEDHIGVTALYASEKYDEGPIIDQESHEISYPILVSDAIDLSIKLYVKLAGKLVSMMSDSQDIECYEQDDTEATYSLWRDESDYRINWNSSSMKILRFINSVSSPYKGACSIVGDELVRIYNAEVYDKNVTIINRDEQCGKIIFMEDEMPIVICKEGLLKITKMSKNIKFRTRFL